MDELQEIARLVKQHRRRQRVPQKIGDVINRLMARRGYGQAELARQFEEAWRNVVGARMAKQSRPVTLRRGVLEIMVRNSTVMQELTFQKSKLLADLNIVAGQDRIRELRFRLGELD